MKKENNLEKENNREREWSKEMYVQGIFLGFMIGAIYMAVSSTILERWF